MSGYDPVRYFLSRVPLVSRTWVHKTIESGCGSAEATPAKKIVWHLKQNDLPGITLAWGTSLELLPSGNIIIGNCHSSIS